MGYLKALAYRKLRFSAYDMQRVYIEATNGDIEAEKTLIKYFYILAHRAVQRHYSYEASTFLVEDLVQQVVCDFYKNYKFRIFNIGECEGRAIFEYFKNTAKNIILQHNYELNIKPDIIEAYFNLNHKNIDDVSTLTIEKTHNALVNIWSHLVSKIIYRNGYFNFCKYVLYQMVFEQKFDLKNDTILGYEALNCGVPKKMISFFIDYCIILYRKGVKDSQMKNLSKALLLEE